MSTENRARHGAGGTFGESFYLRGGGMLRRGGRNLRLLGYLASIAWRWFWVGRVVRRRYRAQAGSRDQVVVDDLWP